MFPSCPCTGSGYGSVVDLLKVSSKRLEDRVHTGDHRISTYSSVLCRIARNRGKIKGVPSPGAPLYLSPGVEFVAERRPP